MIEPNLIDRLVSYVSPEKGAARFAARSRMARSLNTQALYAGASLGRRTSGWRAVSTDANTETRMVLGRLRDASRDMVRNNAFAARAKATIAHNVVGAGILPRVKATSESRTAKIKQLVVDHLETTAIDADGRLNLYGLQALAMATVVESGEVLIRRRPRFTSDGYPLPFQIQVLEPDFLDASVEGIQKNGNVAIQGIEFDARGRRVAYHLFDNHPGSTTPGTSIRVTGKRISADFVAHVFRPERPGQMRGVTWFAPVMLRMRDWADYTDAQLMRQKIAACFAAFITSEDSEAPSDLPTDPGSDYPIESFEPGMIERLKPGENVSFATPPSTSDFTGYGAATLREIAAGLNVPYEALTGDLSGVNYSSGRMGWLEYQRSIDAWRWNMLIPQMLDPLAKWFADAVTLATGSTEPFRFDWTPPRREMIDPDKEMKGAMVAIRAGLSSRSEEIRTLGRDPEEVDAEIAADNIRMDRLGITLDSDPRKTSMNGQQQSDKSGEPAAT
jgi:lambda family phage portal protein